MALPAFQYTVITAAGTYQGFLECLGTDITTAGIVNAIKIDNAGAQNLNTVAGVAADATIDSALAGDFGLAPFKYYEKDYARNDALLTTPKMSSAFIRADLLIGNLASGGDAFSTWTLLSEQVHIANNRTRHLNSLTVLGQDNGDETYSYGSSLVVNSTYAANNTNGFQRWQFSDGAGLDAFVSSIRASGILVMMDDTFVNGQAGDLNLIRNFVAIDGGVGSGGTSSTGAFSDPKPTFTYIDNVFDSAQVGLKVNQDIEEYVLSGGSITNSESAFQPSTDLFEVREVQVDKNDFHLLSFGLTDVTFIDTDLSDNVEDVRYDLQFGGPIAGAIARVEVTHALTITDTSGAAIENARIWLKDEEEDIRFNGLTSSLGVPVIVAPYLAFSNQTVQQGTYDATTKTIRTAHTRRIMAYGFLFQEVEFDAIVPTTTAVQQVTNNNTTAATEALAGLITGVAIDGDDEEITIDESVAATAIYDYGQYWLAGEEDAAPDNIEFDEPLLTADGTNFVLPTGWTLISDQMISGGINLTGDFQLTTETNLTAHNVTTLILTTGGTTEYTITDSTIGDIINTGGGDITVFAVNSTIPLSVTGPNVTVVNPTAGVSAPNLTAGQVQLYNVTQDNEMDNSTITTPGYTHSWENLEVGQADAGDSLRLRWSGFDSSGGSSASEELQAVFGATSDTIVQVLDTPVNDAVYTTYGKDGETIDASGLFVPDYGDGEVDIVIAQNFLGAEWYAWWKFNMATEDGIREFFGVVDALDAANIRIIPGTITLVFDNTTPANIIQLDNIRIFIDLPDVIDQYPVKQPTTDGGIDMVWRDKIFLVETVSANTPQELRDAMLIAPTAGTPESGSIDENLNAVKAKTDPLTFTVTNEVDTNIKSVNDTEVTGDGETGTEWGP